MKGGYKKVPTYWWDFSYCEDVLIVETDDPRVPDGIVKTFKFKNATTIDEVEEYIRGLNEGRIKRV